MKKLIINADDMGLSSSINGAIRKCYKEGAISGVSVLACGKAFKEACEVLHECERPEVGVHLAITGGFTPCTKNIVQISSVLTDKAKFLANYTEFFKHSLFESVSLVIQF